MSDRSSPLSSQTPGASPTRPTSRMSDAAARQHAPAGRSTGSIGHRTPVEPVAKTDPAPTGLRPAIFKVATIVAAGVYTAEVLSGSLTAPSGTTALAESNLGTAATRTVKLLCVSDIGGGNSLAVGDVVVGLLGSVDGATLLAVADGGGAGDLIPVNVATSGGSGTSPASFVYAVTRLDTTSLGSGIAPQMARPAVDMLAGTHGIWSVSASILVWVDEVPDVGTCDPGTTTLSASEAFAYYAG